MSSEPASQPQAIYGERLTARQQALAAAEKAIDRIADVRLGVAALFLGGLIAVWQRLVPGWTLLLPVILFLVLMAFHERAFRRRRHAWRGVRFYQRGLARLEERWDEAEGPRHVPAAVRAEIDDEAAPHPYARDLDLFGPSSLFERVSTVRTRAGEDTLARWLCHPAGLTEVASRQGAIEELRPAVDLREHQALLAARDEPDVPPEAGAARTRRQRPRTDDEVPPGLDPEALARWGESPPRPGSLAIRALAVVVSTLGVAALVGWMTERAPGLPLLVMLAVVWVLHRSQRARIDAVAAAVDRERRDLDVLAGVLAALEAGRFTSPRLLALQAELAGAEGRSASQAIAQLDRLVDRLEARRNQFFAPLAFLLLWSLHLTHAIERWRARSGTSIRRWLAAVGELEALLSLSGYAFEHPQDPFAELVDGQGTVIEGEALAHPLLPVSRAVANDVRLGGGVQLLMVSGSNMSGKSTLLRTVGANVVLALAGAPVRARRLRISPVLPGGTLRIQDSLSEGASRFYAEVKRLRQLWSLTGGPVPLLFMLDEIFAGTNSHDRQIGAEAVLRAMIDKGAVGFCTTHDLSLAKAAELLGDRARNVHFEDQLKGGELSFDYRMREGVVTRSNALELMRAVGLPV